MLRNKRVIFLVIATLLVVLGTIYFSSSKLSDYQIIKIRGYKIKAEVADTVVKQAKGLMFREDLKKDSGMLFVFEEEKIHSFWMKNTYIPLDIIWIDSNLEIVFIRENALPCKSNICESYTPEKEAKYVLEINAGLVKEYKIKVRDQVELIK